MNSGPVVLGSPFGIEMMTQHLAPFINIGERTPLLDHDGVSVYADRSGSDRGTIYRAYRFLLLPNSYLSSNHFTGQAGSMCALGRDIRLRRTLFHHPYLVFDSVDEADRLLSTGFQPSLGDAMWAVIVDSHTGWDQAAWTVYLNGPNPSSTWNSIATMQASTDLELRKRAPTSRRLVIMNATGHVLHERRWDFAEGSSSANGIWEERVYDWQLLAPGQGIGRLHQIRTVGWAAATDKVNDGLIRVFKYDNRTGFEESLEVAAIGNKQGTGTSWDSDVVWQKQLIRDPDRHDLVTYELSFDTPGTALYPWTQTFSASQIQNPPAGVNITYRGYTLESVPQPGSDPEKRIKREVSIRPPAPIPGGVNKFPVEIVQFDYDRQPFLDTWRGYGALENIESLLSPTGTPTFTGGDTFYMDVQRTNSIGQTVFTCVDSGTTFTTVPHYFGPSTGLGYAGTNQPVVPSGWVRQGSGNAGHRWVVTEYEELGPWRVENYQHRGDFYVRRTQPHPKPEFEGEDALATRIYKNAVFDSETQPLGQGSGDVLRVEGPGQINFNGKGGLESHYGWGNHPLIMNLELLSQEVEWTSTWTAYPSGTEEYTVIRNLDLKTNGDGAPTSLSVTPEGSTENRSIHVAYTDLGEVQRQRHVDGTITRHVYDPVGKLLRTYRGTNDSHWYWGAYAAPEDPCNPTYPPVYSDNLVLVEKRAYGATSHDALQLTSLRAYRDKPTDQYHNCGTNNEGSIGWETRQIYDWKMRPVITSNYGEGSSPQTLLHTVTYFDSADRVRFTAIFAGNNLPSGAPANPENAGYAAEVPSVQTILAAEPLRLTETTYNRRGLVEHQREYDTTVTDGSAFLVTSTYYDHADRPIVIKHPNGREERTTYDATGKQLTASMFAASQEQTRSSFVYDNNGRVAEVETLERVDPEGATLTSSNSVATKQYKWHNSKGQLTAAADLGTGSLGGTGASLNTYANPVTFPARPAQSPWAARDGPSGFMQIHRPSPLPEWAKITCYEYDDQGRECQVVGPKVHVTTKSYNAFGELIRQTDNDEGETLPDDHGRRTTVYKYDMGRLVKIAALLDDSHAGDWETTSGVAQVTELIYGAEVVSSSGAQFAPNRNYNNGWVGEVRFPDPVTGQPSSTTNRLLFKYFITGEIAERTDQRGVVIKYTYDTAGRMTRYTVDTGDLNEPSGGFPLDRVHRVDFAYDPTLGHLLNAKAWKSAAAAPGDIIAEAAFNYDQHGNLLMDRQQHGGLAVTGSPTVNYSWLWTPDSATAVVKNINRLATMTYPDRDPGTGVSRRVLTFEYGDHSNQSDVDASLCRMTGILSNGGFGSAAVARYEYSGQGRRIVTRLGDTLDSGGQPLNAASRQFARSSGFGSVGFDGLDTFGRVLDRHSTNQTGATQHRARYSYDQNDNPLSVLITQAVWNNESRDNTRSFKFDYDNLDRLIKSDTGTLNSTATAIETGGPVMPVLSSWGLGRVDNWNGVGSQSGIKREGDLAGNGTWSTKSVNHATNQTNQLTSVSTSTGGNPVVTNVYHDRAGNLIADQNYYYIYDGLNRLVQVCERGSLEFDPPVEDPFTGQAGSWLISYTYDGLGRLIRTQRPWPAPSATPTLVRIEHFYYDGVRRIQEEFVDPLVDSETETKGVGAKEEEDAPPQPQTVTWIEREYIWGPDYVDELVSQVVPGATETILYALTEHAGTVTTLINPSGAVQAQYSFDPYGEVFAADVSTSMPRNRVGHQGLFFDRLTGTTLDQQLGRGNLGTYYNRNRTYAPGYGRFLQRDPHAVGQVIQGLSNQGASPRAGMPGLTVNGHYRDGLNTFAFVQSRPTHSSDPAGLFIWVGGELVGGATRETLRRGSLGPLVPALGSGLKGWLAGLLSSEVGGAVVLSGGGGLVAVGSVAMFGPGQHIKYGAQGQGEVFLEKEDTAPMTAQEAAENLPDDAYVVRGGSCSEQAWANGTGVQLVDGKIRGSGASVQSAPGISHAELAKYVPHDKYGWAFVSEVRALGGSVIPTPTGRGYHCSLFDLTPAQAAGLFEPRKMKKEE